jgi:hypothetical protein
VSCGKHTPSVFGVGACGLLAASGFAKHASIVEQLAAMLCIIAGLPGVHFQHCAAGSA